MKIKGLLIVVGLLLSFSALKAQTYLISNGGTINTCSGTLYDSGGANSTYNSNENSSITICSDMAGSALEILFTEFDLESATWDHLTIYDGTNTSAPVLVSQVGNSELLDETITASGECLHFVFHSDGSVQHDGFAAEISCLFPCQDFTIDIVSPALPVFPDTAMYACPGVGANFEAQGNFPNNNQNYEQSDANLTWTWTVTLFDDVDYAGVGMNVLPYTFDEPGGNWVRLMATDINGCSYVYPDTFLVYSAVQPTFPGTTLGPEEVCPGEQVNLSGGVAVDPWIVTIPEVVNDMFCASDDFIDEAQCAEFTHTAFAPGQTINSVDDIEALCMDLEHSYIGDLDLYITCPNGQTVNLITYPSGCGSTYFGEPLDEWEDDAPDIDCDDESTIGVLYHYCWTPDATTTIADACDGADVIPEGNYMPEGNFQGLVGCPINGTWQICFVDNLGSDDGAVANFILQFSDDILPSEDSLWQFQNTYSDNDLVWTGDGLGANTGGTANAFPTTSGNQPMVFSVTDDFGCTYDTTLYVNVLSEDDPTCCTQPEANAGPDDMICSNSYTLTTELSMPINTVTWTQISGPGNVNFNGQENSTNPTVTVDAYGVYQFLLVEQNLTPACTDSDTVEIAFYLMPTPTFSASFIPCNDDESSVVYEGNGDPTMTYNWDFDGAIGGGNGQGPFNLSWADPGNHTVTLSVENNGCISDDTLIHINMPSLLTGDLTYEDDPCFNTCEGFAQIIVNGGTNPYTYSWGANHVNENLCAGDYSITVTDNNGCEISQNYTINQPNELLINSATTSDLDCYNSNDGEIVVHASGGAGGLSYNWSDGGSGPNRQNLPAGNYSVNIVDQNGCSIIEYYTLTQPDELMISISPDQAHCEGAISTITTEAIGGTQPYVFYWDQGNGFSPNANEITVSPSQTTTFVAYVGDANGCSSSPVSMTMTISPEMSLSLITEDNKCHQSCDGSAELHLTGGIPPFNYSWPANGPVYDDLCAGAYDVTVTDILGCSESAVFHISEPPKLFAEVYTRDATCFGYADGRAVVEANGGVPNYEFLWPDGSQNDTIILPAGIHEVTVSDSRDCRLTVEAVVGQPDAVYAEVLVPDDIWICKGSSTQLNSQSTGGTPHYDFSWEANIGDGFIVNDPIVEPDTTTEYTLTVVDSHGCSSNRPNVIVHVYPDLAIEHVTTSYDTICPRDAAIIEVDAVGGNGGPYTLTLHDGQVVPTPFTVYPVETTNYVITLTDACGTPAVADSIEIFVLEDPENNFVSDVVEGCPPFVVNFNEVNDDNGRTYLWSFGDDGFGFEKNPTHVYEEGGWYPVTLTVTSEHGCKKVKTQDNMIFVYEKPMAEYYTDQNYVSVLDPEVQFFNISEMADSCYWYFGDGDSSRFISPSHNFDANGEYEVVLVVESREGCYDTIMKTINVRDEFAFYAPTAFTPNGDGDNDFFMVYGHGIDPNEFSLIIYDRWGELMFESDIYDPDMPANSAWDGTYNGNHLKGDKLIANGIYYWYCKFKDFTGVWHEEEGTVNLIR